MLSRNKLSEIPNSIVNIEGLIALWINGNTIRSFPKNFETNLLGSSSRGLSKTFNFISDFMFPKDEEKFFLGYLCKYNIPQSHRGSKIFWHLKYI